MIEDITPGTVEEIFIVRQGSGGSARYAICHRVATMTGGDRIAGVDKTVAEIVDEQDLSAAVVSGERYDDLRVATFEPQSGLNLSIIQHPR